MGELPTFERRKNPSRRRGITFDVSYRVIWNQRQHTFDVYRGDELTGASAPDKAAAIDLAIQSARQEDSSLKVSVSAIRNGKMTIEWSN